MPVSDYVYRCESCGDPTVNLPRIYDRAEEWPGMDHIPDREAFVLVMGHGVFHTLSAYLGCHIMGNGVLKPWQEGIEQRVASVAAVAAAGACWLLLASWSTDPFGLGEELLDLGCLRVVSSRTLVHMHLHELAKPPAGDT